MYEEKEVIDWQAPSFEADASKRQDWIENQVTEGEKWLDAQGSFGEENLKLLGATGPEKLKSSSAKPDIRKFVETISDIREIATYGGASQYKSIVDTFNKTAKFIYQDSQFAHQTREALQFAVAQRRGYLWPVYRRADFGWGEGKIHFFSLGPREVLPTQVPRSNDIQGSYAVTIIECMGIAEAHARFPAYQDQLLPISKFKYSSNNQIRRHEAWDRRYGSDLKNWEDRYCEIRWTHIRDLRINRTGKMLSMGEKNTSWFYEVPSLGSVISWTNPENGLPESRQATAEDCRIYPQLRLMISNPGMSQPMYDGPAYDMHGLMPAVQYDVDDWPWMAIGYSLLQDIAGVERAQRGFVDLLYRVLKRRMNPPLGYDLDSGVPREDIKRFDWLDEDAPRIGVSGDPKKALVSLLPDSLNVDDKDFKMLDVFEKIRQKALGLSDLQSLAQLKFNISSDNFDKMLETLGPIAKGISLNLEKSARKIADIVKFDILQYMSTRDLLSYVGADGVSPILFDFNPNDIVPSHMPFEADKNSASQFSRNQRARWFAKNLKTVSVPNNIINVTHMQEQLKWLNFLQRGLPVSYSTAFKKLGVENWGETPGDTEFEKWKHEQFEMLDMKMKAAALAAVEGPGEHGANGKGQGKGGGRPPTGKQPPKLEQRGNKTGNPRTVVSQSK